MAQAGVLLGQEEGHTLKSQVAVDEGSSLFVDVSDLVPGRWADIKLFGASRVSSRLPEGTGSLGDLVIDALHGSSTRSVGYAGSAL